MEVPGSSWHLLYAYTVPHTCLDYYFIKNAPHKMSLIFLPHLIFLPKSTQWVRTGESSLSYAFALFQPYHKSAGSLDSLIFLEWSELFSRFHMWKQNVTHFQCPKLALRPWNFPSVYAFQNASNQEIWKWRNSFPRKHPHTPHHHPTPQKSLPQSLLNTPKTQRTELEQLEEGSFLPASQS